MTNGKKISGALMIWTQNMSGVYIWDESDTYVEELQGTEDDGDVEVVSAQCVRDLESKGRLI